MPTTASATNLRGRPERVFVSVDESTGKSTMSFHPADIGSPVQHDGDHKGEAAMKEARSIAAKYPGCTVHGPHFHTARPAGKMKMRRRSSPNMAGSPRDETPPETESDD